VKAELAQQKKLIRNNVGNELLSTLEANEAKEAAK
jgi:hypothetical protein